MKLTRFAALLLGTALGTAACQSDNSKTATTSAPTPVTLLKAGPWRGELAAQGQQIPFLFEVKEEAGKPVVYLINKGLDGEERLRCPEITQAGDSVTVRLHVFDAALVLRADSVDKQVDISNPDSAWGTKPKMVTIGRMVTTDRLKGTWVKYDAKMSYRVPIVAFLSTNESSNRLFHSNTKVSLIPSSKEFTYKAGFKDEEGNSYPAVGIFKGDSASQGIAGTFLTTTGDYRYLFGNYAHVNGQWHMKLSTFDGNHAFLFDAVVDMKQSNKLLKGDFYSGKSGHETFTAVLDPNAKLPDANALTAMKPGQKRLDFKFPNIFEGGAISPTDPKYQGKVVVVQILGSWCPNCMDETNFLAPWYEQNKQRGVEIIGLGYERSPDQKKAAARLHKMRERFNIKYDLAVAGVANKDSAAKSLPQLAQVLAFPTTIFLDKKGEVRKIHTGFSGPGTGKYYRQEIAEFNQTVDQLLKE